MRADQNVVTSGRPLLEAGHSSTACTGSRDPGTELAGWPWGFQKGSQRPPVLLSGPPTSNKGFIRGHEDLGFPVATDQACLG